VSRWSVRCARSWSLSGQEPASRRLHPGPRPRSSTSRRCTNWRHWSRTTKAEPSCRRWSPKGSQALRGPRNRHRRGLDGRDAFTAGVDRGDDVVIGVEIRQAHLRIAGGLDVRDLRHTDRARHHPRRLRQYRLLRVGRETAAMTGRRWCFPGSRSMSSVPRNRCHRHRADLDRQCTRAPFVERDDRVVDELAVGRPSCTKGDTAPLMTANSW